MANRYVLVHQDGAGNLQLSPVELKVNTNDTVVWVSNLVENYVAAGFTPKKPTDPTQLFQQASYSMPAQSQSIPGVVVAVVVPGPSAVYTYKCSDATGGSQAMAAGDSVDGVIIVDPTGPGNGPEEQKGSQVSDSKRSSAKEPALQTNGSRR